MKLLCLLPTLYFLFGCSLLSDYDYGPIVLMDYGFEEGHLADWEGQYSLEGVNFAFSETAPFSGRYCGKFSIGAGRDLWTSPTSGIKTARSEIQRKGTAPAETELYYSWQLKIDADYSESDDWQVIGQFHDQPDPALGQTWAFYPAHNPPLAYKYRNGQLVVAVYSWDSAKVVDIAAVPLSKGVWHRLDTRVLWSTDAQGFVESWLDGSPIAGSTGQSRYTGRNCFNKAGNYLKIGLYRSNEIDTAATVYFDAIKSGLTRSATE